MSLDDTKGFALFILDALRPRYSFGDGSKQSKVAYLDGLRGVAAFIVYWTHYTGFSHDGVWAFRNAYGWHGGYYFATLPFVRIFFHGGAFAVASFFIISGYVLSVSPLKMIHSQADDGLRLARQIGCSFPRRWVRLYTPVVGTTLLFAMSWHIFGIQSGAPGNQGPRPNIILELSRWIYEFGRGSYVYNVAQGFGAGNYNTTLWSIATEYRGSAIIYAVLIAFMALEYGPTQRFWSLVGLWVYFLYYVDGTYFALFIMGMLLADLDLVAENDPFHLPKIVTHFKFMSSHRYLYYIPLFVGLYLCSAPHVQRASELGQEPGWGWAAILIPPTAMNARWFLAAWGSTFIAISIPRIAWLRWFFESSLCQYLGKISFGFYLVHGPVIWTVGDRILAAVGRPHMDAVERVPGWMDIFPMSDWGPLGLEINCVTPQLIILPVTLYFAGVVTKLFDEPSVKFSKWLFSPPPRK